MSQLQLDATLAKRIENLRKQKWSCCANVADLIEQVELSETYHDYVETYAALSDEKRLLVLGMLNRTSELSACEIQAALDVSHATVNHHMGILLSAGLVKEHKRGKWVVYQLEDEAKNLVP